VIDKIFQPFLTTKPPGQGTGLGLSLTYDIIAKENGITVLVESVENEFAEFVIILPMQ
jgi:two-component system NtrC family sensor kinase